MGTRFSRGSRWFAEIVHLTALSVSDAEDNEIFLAAKKAADVVITKDSDFCGTARTPRAPKIIWLTCGNTSDAALRKILTANFQEALRLLDAGDEVVEIGSP